MELFIIDKELIEITNTVLIGSHFKIVNLKVFIISVKLLLFIINKRDCIKKHLNCSQSN